VTKTYLKYKPRITILAGFIILSWVGLCVRLFQVQVLNGEQYQIAVVNQSQKKQILPANRGNIFDRKDKPLTRNIIHYTPLEIYCTLPVPCHARCSFELLI